MQPSHNRAATSPQPLHNLLERCCNGVVTGLVIVVAVTVTRLHGYSKIITIDKGEIFNFVNTIESIKSIEIHQYPSNSISSLIDTYQYARLKDLLGQ